MRFTAAVSGALATAAVLLGDGVETASALSQQPQRTALLTPRDVHFEEVEAEERVSAALAEVEQEQQKNVVKAKLAKVVKAVKQALRKIGLLQDRKCEEKKKSGTPSAAHGDAPIEAFGYPYFDQNTGASILKAQVALSLIEGHKQPVRVGAKDWMAQGTLSELVSLFICFEDYPVIGEFLQPSGHWDSTEGTGRLYVQLQNVNKHQGSAGEILLSYSLDRIKGAIDMWGVIDNTVGKWFEAGVNAAKKVEAIVETYNTVRERIPDLNKESFEKFWNEVARANTPSEKMKAFATLFYNASRARLHGQWESLERVNPGEKLTVFITSYPSTSPMRATFAFDENAVTMGDIGAALAAVVRNPELDKIFEKAGMASRA